MSVTLTFDKLSKSGKYALYKGLRTVARLAISDFVDSKPLPSFTVNGEFAGPREKKAPKVKLTKEQRAALPKPTLAQKAAALEARLAKLRAQAAAEEQATA